ncbi:hypothetical protein GGX14DRAFT_657725, partial [Mycena pura]
SRLPVYIGRLPRSLLPTPSQTLHWPCQHPSGFRTNFIQHSGHGHPQRIILFLPTRRLRLAFCLLIAQQLSHAVYSCLAFACSVLTWHDWRKSPCLAHGVTMTVPAEHHVFGIYGPSPRPESFSLGGAPAPIMMIKVKSRSRSKRPFTPITHYLYDTPRSDLDRDYALTTRLQAKDYATAIFQVWGATASSGGRRWFESFTLACMPAFWRIYAPLTCFWPTGYRRCALAVRATRWAVDEALMPLIPSLQAFLCKLFPVKETLPPGMDVDYGIAGPKVMSDSGGWSASKSSV